jgi:hypothetical protein
MKKLEWYHWIIIVAGIFIFAVVYQGYRIVNMALDFQVISLMVNDEGGAPAGGPPARRPSPPLVAALTPPPVVKQLDLGSLVSSPFPESYRQPALVPIEKIREIMSGIPEDWQASFARHVPSLIEAQITSLPTPPPIPARVSLFAPSHDFRTVRESIRCSYALARMMAASGKHLQALQTMGGIFLAAHLLEADSPNGIPLIAKMIGIALRNIGSIGLLEVAPTLELPGEVIGPWVRHLNRLAQQNPSIELAFLYESRLVPSVFNAEALAEFVRKNPGKRSPRTLIHALAQKKLHDEYHQVLYAPGIEAAKLPYPDAMTKTKMMVEKSEEIAGRMSRIGPHWIGYAIQPERFFLDVFYSIAVPNVNRALEQDFQCRQKMNGALTTLALCSFRRDQGRLPATLAELQTWVGTTFPDDLFGKGPLQFSRTGPKILFSVGPDSKPDTADDLVFYPLPHIPPAGQPERR